MSARDPFCYTYARYLGIPTPQQHARQRRAPHEEIDVVLLRYADGAGVRVSELKSKDRARHLTAARRRFVKLARRRGYSLSAIGRALELHHTSVMHLARTRVTERAGEVRR